jgi:pilus assembly protein CpaC
METDIELGEGQTFLIGGLLDERVTESLAKVPGLSHIPILGALFKSRSENKSKTELLVMVTPETTYPYSATDAKPLPHMPKEFLSDAPSRGQDDKKTPPAPGSAKPAKEIAPSPGQAGAH